MTGKIINDFQINVLHRNLLMFQGLVTKKLEECSTHEELEHIRIIEEAYRDILPNLNSIVTTLAKCKKDLEKIK